jgi:hypothetical protein
MVTSFPSRFTNALPIGNKYSSSGTSPFSAVHYFTLHEKSQDRHREWKTLIGPFASYGLLTEITFKARDVCIKRLKGS